MDVSSPWQVVRSGLLAGLATGAVTHVTVWFVRGAGFVQWAFKKLRPGK